MLLEVNQLGHLIVDRPAVDLAGHDVWQRLRRLRVAILCDPATEQTWRDAVGAQHVVIAYDYAQTYGAQANIRRALEALGAEPYNSAYVCFSAADLAEAINTRIGTFQVGGAIGDAIPDVFLRVFPDAIIDLDGGAPLARVGFLAENVVTLGGGVPPAEGGQALWIPRFFSSLPHIAYRDELQDVRLLILGRYFPKEDARHDKHQLSRRMWHLKQMDAHGAIFASVIGGAFHLVDQREPVFDVVTRIPPKPSKCDHDHLAWAMRSGAARADTRFLPAQSISGRLDFDLLRCVREYPPQKEARSYANRAANVAGAFEVARRVDGQHVVMVDDVMTSGSTAAECAHQLLRSGAARVTVIAIARNQRVIGGISAALPCPNASCSGVLQLKPGANAQFFWGCSCYWSAGCRESRVWRTGLLEHNRLNTRDDIPSGDDIAF